MKILSFHNATAEVALTAEELGVINNALNEVCNGVDLEGEFDTRMGCSVEEARELLRIINTLTSKMRPHTSSF
ncbi:MAG TPA: hypothetical protein VGI16_00005 [Candidatus Acidoferrum sp.]